MGGRGGSSAGATGFRGRGNRALAAYIARKGGLHNAEYMRGGMRPLDLHRAAYAGATAAQAQAIATGRRRVMNASQMPSTPYFAPVKVTVSARGRVHLVDGRHRMVAAKEAGATHVSAVVTQLGKGGKQASIYTGPVKI